MRTRPPMRLRREIRRELSNLVGAASADRLLTGADALYPEIAGRIPETRRGARHLLRMSAYCIAVHHGMLEEGCNEELARGVISEAVFASIRGAHDLMSTIGRLIHRDRLRRALWRSRLLRKVYYTEPDWHIEDVEVADGFGFDITRCVVAEFFDSFELGELCQSAICDQDVRIAARYGSELERHETLAAGAPRCDFRYHIASFSSTQG